MTERERADANPAEPGARRLALAGLLAGAGLLSAWAVALSSSGIDFYALRTAARCVDAQPSRPFYHPAEGVPMGAEAAAEALAPHAPARLRAAASAVLGANAGSLPVAASPALLAMARVFSQDDYESSYRAYAAALILALVLSVGLLGSHLGLGTADTLLLLALTASAFDPFLSDVRVANVGTFVLAAICSAVVVGGRRGLPPARRLAAGALLGFAVALKPLALGSAGLLLLLWRPVRGDAVPWPFFGAVLGVLAAAGLSLSLFASPAAWVAWLGSLSSTAIEGFPFEMGNVGLSRLLLDATGVRVGLPLLAGLAVSACLIAFRRAGEPPRAETETWCAAAGAAVMLVAGGLAWLHYFVLAVPFVVLAVRHVESRAWRVTLPLVAGALAALPGMPQLLPGGHLTRAWLLNAAVLALAAGTFPRRVRPTPP